MDDLSLRFRGVVAIGRTTRFALDTRSVEALFFHVAGLQLLTPSLCLQTVVTLSPQEPTKALPILLNPKYEDKIMKKRIAIFGIAILLSGCAADQAVVTGFNGDSVEIQTSQLGGEAAFANAQKEANRL